MEGKTIIQISNESWRSLNSDKHQGETFDDVIKRWAIDRVKK